MRPNLLLRVFNAVALSAAASAGIASAQPYIGASVATTRGDLYCDGYLSCDRRDTAAGLHAGYWFSPYFGIEARYTDLGETARVLATGMPPETRETWSAQAAAVAAVGAWPITDRWRVAALVGAARTRSVFRSGLFPGEAKANVTEPYYGLALSYAVSPALGVRLEADRYRADFLGVMENFERVGVGLTYTFR